ncbi:MAG: ATP-binding protein, partial [Hyphomicrobiales bacterium]|nr:ATP-binding protein [Hyphomicrobiales bacterium]
VKFHKDLVIGRDYLSLLKLGLPRNASVIAVLGSVGHVALQFFISQANLILTYIALENDTPISSEVVDFYLKNPSVLVQLNKDIDALGLGIHKIEITTSQDRTFMMFHHEGLIQPIISQFESNGTRQAVKLFPYIGVVLSRGGIAVIDELDQALHPFVLSEVVRWFHDPIRNPHNAQLWMTCQNASLLHELDKEEVLFCEKDSKGQTSVYSLADVKGARRGEDFYKKYLGGVYGAVPQIG